MTYRVFITEPNKVMMNSNAVNNKNDKPKIQKNKEETYYTFNKSKVICLQTTNTAYN